MILLDGFVNKMGTESKALQRYCCYCPQTGFNLVRKTKHKHLQSETEMRHLRQCIRATIRYFPERLELKNQISIK